MTLVSLFSKMAPNSIKSALPDRQVAANAAGGADGAQLHARYVDSHRRTDARLHSRPAHRERERESERTRQIRVSPPSYNPDWLLAPRHQAGQLRGRPARGRQVQHDLHHRLWHEPQVSASFGENFKNLKFARSQLAKRPALQATRVGALPRHGPLRVDGRASVGRSKQVRSGTMPIFEPSSLIQERRP